MNSFLRLSNTPLCICTTGLFQRVSSSHQVAKVLEFQLQSQSFNKYSGLISFRMEWLELLAVQATLKGLLQHHSSKASILRRSALFIFQLSHPCVTTGKTVALTRRTWLATLWHNRDNSTIWWEMEGNTQMGIGSGLSMNIATCRQPSDKIRTTPPSGGEWGVMHPWESGSGTQGWWRGYKVEMGSGCLERYSLPVSWTLNFPEIFLIPYLSVLPK